MWNIGQMLTIALRAITHRNEIEKMVHKVLAAEVAIKQVMDTVLDAHQLASKIAPELIGPYNSMVQATYDVRWLQRSLNTLIDASLTVDGDYGPKTKAAVTEFQRRNPPLVVDGWAGALTEARIVELLTPR